MENKYSLDGYVWKYKASISPVSIVESIFAIEYDTTALLEMKIGVPWY